jgi:hypothetical protein
MSRRAANHAQGEDLCDLFGGSHEKCDGLEGQTPEVLVKTGHDHTAPPVGQDFADSPEIIGVVHWKQLGFVNANDLCGLVNEGQQMVDAFDGPSFELATSTGLDCGDPVPGIHNWLEQLNPAVDDHLPSNSPDHFLRFSRKHAASDYFDPAHIVGHFDEFHPWSP